MDPELGKDVRDVPLGGRLGDAQIRSDLPIGLTAGDQPRDLLLAWAQ
jgi:hypothetical protein